MDIKPLTSDEQLEFISKVYDANQNIVSLADSKANMSITIQSILIGIALGSSLIINTLDKIRKLNNNLVFSSFYFLLFFFISISMIGIVCSILVYKNRLPAEKCEMERDGLIYFNHISKIESSDQYVNKIRAIDKEGIVKDYGCQVYQIARIISAKMYYLNISIYCLILNIICSILIILLSGYISVA